MESPVVVAANAKINLALDVIGKRDDGYHEVVMIMQSVGLADRVTLHGDSGGGIGVAADFPGLDCGPGNLAYRAAELLRSRFAVSQGVQILLEKRIPMAAGLAGGSADAAAVLRGLNRLWRLGLGRAELEALGAELGSDVPFCLRGGTALATGRGEKLLSLPGLPQVWTVLAKPAVDVSTAWVYGRFRAEKVEKRPDINGMLDCLKRRDLPGVTERAVNVLETVTAAAYPEIALLKRLMLDGGAMASLMSGSGPTVFGFAASRDTAEHIAAALKKLPGVAVFVTETVQNMEEEDGSTLTAG